MKHLYLILRSVGLVLLVVTISGFQLPSVPKMPSVDTIANAAPEGTPLPAELVDALGDVAYSIAMDSDGKYVTDDPNFTIPVYEVAERLIEAAKRSNFAEPAGKLDVNQIKVVKMDDIEAAVAFTGGKIIVYTGIFTIAKNRAGLAAVLSHEMIHALARHPETRIDRQLISGLSMAGGAMAIKDQLNPEQTAALMGAMGLGFVVGVELPFAREQELEADHLGLSLMANGGYDPNEALKVMKRIVKRKQARGGTDLEFLSSHPDPEKREQQLVNWLETEHHKVINPDPNAEEVLPL